MQQTSPNPTRQPDPGPPGMPRRLTRSSREKMWAGVCGGLGEYFGVDPVLIAGSGGPATRRLLQTEIAQQSANERRSRRSVLDRLAQTDTTISEVISHDVEEAIRLADESIAELNQDIDISQC